MGDTLMTKIENQWFDKLEKIHGELCQIYGEMIDREYAQKESTLIMQSMTATAQVRIDLLLEGINRIGIIR